MNKIFLSFVSVVFGLSLAQAACVGEAQIIAKVGSVKAKNYSSCRVNVEAIEFYSVNQLCPLSLADVAAAGVDVGIKDGHDCGMQAGEVLTGVIYVAADGLIRLEK